MIEALIWDFGGVLTTSPFEAFRRFETERGLPRDFLRSVNARNADANAWARFERAEIDAEAFDRAFARESAALGFEIGGAEILPLLSGSLRPRMIAALTAAKGRYKLGCITNNVPAGKGSGMSLGETQARAVAEVLDIFDHVLESSKIGLRKPDPRIYEMMVEALGVTPARCIYLDDLGINLKPARTMGMTTIKVGDPAAAIAELEGHLGMKLG
jgi:putative hydrolase of the HAD superfamily